MTRMGTIALALAAALLGTAEAEQLTDAVPGHPGVTYGDLMKQAVPDLAQQDGGLWSGALIPALGDLAGNDDPNDLSGGFAFGSVDVLTVKEGGKSRILLLTGGAETDSFAEILAAFDGEAQMPALLDVADAGSDRLASFGAATFVLDDGTDLFQIRNEHSNSNQSYSDIALVFLKDGKLKRAVDVKSFGERVCTHEIRETPAIRTVRDRGARYRAIDVGVTELTTLTDLDCGEAGAERPKPARKVWRDVFHWDETKQAYVSKTDRLGELARRNEERF